MTSGALHTIRSSLARASAADSTALLPPLPLPPDRIRSVPPRRLRLPPVGGRQASIRLGSGRTPSSSSFIGRIPVGHVTLERAAENAQLIGTLRSEERRVGKECVSKCRSQWSLHHQKTNLEYEATLHNHLITDN